MASRVNISITARDLTGPGLAAVRNQLRDLDRQIGRTGGTVTVRIPHNATRADIARIRQMVNSLPRSVRIRLRVDEPPPAQIGRIRRSLNNLGRGLGGFIGGTLSDGIGQGLVGAAKSPPVLAGILALAASLLSILGAALAGGLTLLLGGAVAGIGIFLAAQIKGVRAKFGDALKEVQSLFTEAARPMLPIIEDARVRMLQLARDWAPEFQTALDAMSGPLQRFLGAFDQGIRNLMETAGPGLTRAFGAFLEAYGPMFEEFMADLGDALDDLADTVSEHSTEIAMAFDIVMRVIIAIIQTIDFFAESWVRVVNGTVAMIAFMADGFADLLDVVLATVEGMIGAMSTVTDIIPGIGPAVEAAKQKFHEFREGIVGDMHTAADNIRGFTETIARQNQRNKITADIGILEAKVNTAKRKLQETNDKKVQAKIKADISQLNSQIAAARERLAAIDGTVAITRIITYSDTYKSVHDIVGKASGGIRGLSRAATGGARGNMTLVGEQGAEIVDLPPGSRVRSHGDSMRALSGAGGGMEPIVVNLVVDGKVLASAMVEPQRELVRTRGGGSAQQFFGQKGRG